MKQPTQSRWHDHQGSTCSLGVDGSASITKGFNAEWIFYLQFQGMKVYSQNEEDGMLVYIFQNIGISDKFYVEFGTQNGDERNTRFLQERCGWHGLLFDGGFSNTAINLTKAFLTPTSIGPLFETHRVPHDFDLMSIDIDSTDLWIWRNLALTHGYKPRVVVIEFNRNYAIDEYWTFPNDPNVHWASASLKDKFGDAPADCLMGASLAALDLLSKQIGYTLVGTDRAATNAFFLRDDVLTQSGATAPPLAVLHPPPQPLHQPCSSDRMKLRVDYKWWSEQNP
eukprot:CAMPEP_0179213008 /NCGR_PEP_ID=MMETSP0797-20121207/1432_1 /TAXON_ID=47934 /ORGANISM="Dinophysis acuminata, Strain DAEP01" /LENGTH=281 /DNA_ID=CAMNT_0020918703 /DNA_START=269 /DNA_END=1114 /DNA_ORIENTATION=-